MRNGLPRRRNVTGRLEEETESNGNATEVVSTNNDLELSDALRQVGDIGADSEVAAAVAAPGRGHRSLGEVGEEGSKVVRLLELAVADLDEVGEVGADGGEEFASEGGLALEEAKKRVLGAVLSSLKTRRCLPREGTSTLRRGIDRGEKAAPWEALRATQRTTPSTPSSTPVERMRRPS
jgi:hypothetical protein